MNQFNFNTLESVPTPLALWAALTLMRRYSHRLDDYNSPHHAEVRECVVKVGNIARAIKKEADAKKAAKKN